MVMHIDLLFLCSDENLNFMTNAMTTYSIHFIFVQMKSIVILLVCLFFASTLSSQIRFDADFHSPVGIPIILAANFGELRSNHFHTGIDIKTKGQEGYKLYAIADGYVSRIKVSPFGYGKAIYIDHPELGITSVYAHCQNFYGAIQDYVLSEQYKSAFFEVELFPDSELLRVKKGEVIAISGNTGGSSAPHLHFEIRETKTEYPLNPLLFDFFEIADTRSPEIRALKFYGVSEHGYRIPGKEKTVSVSGSSGKYYVPGNQVSLPAHFCSEHGGVGMAVRVIDRYDAAQNVCGIYEANLRVNADTAFRQRMDKLDFGVNRQINTHMDYEEFKFKKLGYEKLFRTPHNKLPIYPLTTNGILGLHPGNSYVFDYSAVDYSGNQSNVQFTLSVAEGELRKEDTPYDIPVDDYMYPDSVYQFSGDWYQIDFGDYLLYEPTKMYLKDEGSRLIFGDSKVPLNDYFTMHLKLPLSIVNPDKVVTVVTNYKGGTTALKGTIKRGWITVKSREMGMFTIAEDTLAPLVRNTNFVDGGAIAGKSLLTWSVSDDLAGLSYYAVYINDVYQVLEYEPKRTQLFTSVSDLPKGKHAIRIVVRDAVGNENTQTYTVIK